jgi:hypothetical protein
MAQPAAQPALFLSHGAAIYTTDPRDPTCQWLRAYGAELRRLRPSALLVVSAHYEAHPVRVTASQAPPTLHDHPVRALYAAARGGRGWRRGPSDSCDYRGLGLERWLRRSPLPLGTGGGKAYTRHPVLGAAPFCARARRLRALPSPQSPQREEGPLPQGRRPKRATPKS